MLVAIFVLAAQHQAQFGIYSTALTDLYRVHFPFAGPFSTQGLLFLAFAFAFAIKVPLFPFHTWLPDAHVEAPTAGSVILAGVLLKFGGYGFIRFAFPFFPEAVRYFQEPVMLLASIAIIYGAMMALVQTDVKKLVAYSSVSHMGYVMLGLFSLNATAVSGALYQMLSHGVSTGALFILVGMIYERRHTREVSAFGGLAKSMPRYALAFVLIGFSAIGLPGLNGFVGEFLILLGSWQAHRVVVAIAVLGVLFGAIYVLWLLQRMFFGSIDKAENENPGDLCLREWFVILPFLFAVIAMGIVPNVFFQRTDSAVQRVLSKVISERGD
jgi:NADH-quinone oxidoreductase subunit M